jgi:hypothetical protein
MQTWTLSHDAPTFKVAHVRVGARLRRWILSSVLAAALLIGGYEAYRGLESHGAIIRHDLARAGGEVASLSWSTPRERVAQAVYRRFPGYQVTVEASGFPAYVMVTLHDLNRADCRAVRRLADRIEGNVVIAMERSSGAACQERTSITWRIMP